MAETILTALVMGSLIWFIAGIDAEHPLQDIRRKSWLLLLNLVAIAITAGVWIRKEEPKVKADTALITESNYTIEIIGNTMYTDTTGTNEAPSIEWVEVNADNFSDWDPYTPEQRAKHKADRKRRGRDTFGLEIANDGTNLVLVTHDYSAMDGSNKRLIFPLTNRFVQVSFYFNGEIDVSKTNSSIREVEGNLNLSDERGFWIEPNRTHVDGHLYMSNCIIIHASGGWERVVEGGGAQ